MMQIKQDGPKWIMMQIQWDGGSMYNYSLFLLKVEMFQLGVYEMGMLQLYPFIARDLLVDDFGFYQIDLLGC